MNTNTTEFLADRITRMKPSASIAAKALVDHLRAEGRDIIDFTVGEPDLPTPEHVIDAAIHAMRSGQTKYTASSGTVALRGIIAAKLKQDVGVDYTVNEIVVGSGAKHILFNALSVTLNPGDEVIIPAPYWVSYPDMVAVSDGVPVIVQCRREDGFKLTANALESAITPRTKWIILNTPNNPTGSVYSNDELKAIGEVLARHPHVWLMSDEIYEHYVFNGLSHTSPIASIPEVRNRSLLISGASKGYCMTGWRIGYAAGPGFLIDAISKLITQSTTCPSSIGQAAAVAAFADRQTPRAACDIFAGRANLMAQLLREIEGIDIDDPQGAFYLFASVAGLIGKKTASGQNLVSDLDVVRYLISEAGVATLDGAAYGMSPFIRLSFATSEEAIREGCSRIREACAKLI